MQHPANRSRKRRRTLATVIASTLVVGVIGLGAPAATAAPPQPSASTRITIIQRSIHLAVGYLQHTPNGAGTVVLNSNGSGYVACCGGSTGTLPVLTFEGGGSTSPV